MKKIINILKMLFVSESQVVNIAVLILAWTFATLLIFIFFGIFL
jgi:hypothetical protein